MGNIRDLAPEQPAPEAYAMTAAMALEHLGNLFTFLDQRLGEMAMFDPAAKVQEAVLREGIRVGAKVCRVMVDDGKAIGVSSDDLRELWPLLVERAALTTTK